MAHIEVGEGGTMFVGREATDLFRLMALRSALKAEKLGMRLSRGVSALKLAKVETKLKTNDRDAHIAALDKIIETARQSIPMVRS